ncbi:unnamed protein product, partial [Iphiclides podalirius]
MLCASTFVRLQIAQRRNFFERGVNTVRWARLRHCHVAIFVTHGHLPPFSLSLSRSYGHLVGAMDTIRRILRAQTSRTELRHRLTGRHSVGAIWLGIRTLGGSGVRTLCGAQALSFLGYARTDPQPDTSQIQEF